MAIVTGGAEGIGYAIAEAFVTQGVTTIVTDINRVAGKQTADKLASLGNRGEFIFADVSRASQVEDVVTSVVASYGGINVLVNNAGIVNFEPLIEMSEANWDRLMDVDLKGVFLCTKFVLPHMIDQHSGVILNISSNHAFATLPDSEAYAAAKGGMIAFTQGLAQSYGSRGIRAVAICPGYTDTPHYQYWLEQSPEPFAREKSTLALHPLGRIVRPDDIAKLVTFLASDDAAMITGTSVVVDGGVLSRLHF